MKKDEELQRLKKEGWTVRVGSETPTQLILERYGPKGIVRTQVHEKPKE